MKKDVEELNRIRRLMLLLHSAIFECHKEDHRFVINDTVSGSEVGWVTVGGHYSFKFAEGQEFIVLYHYLSVNLSDSELDSVVFSFVDGRLQASYLKNNVPHILRSEVVIDKEITGVDKDGHSN